MEELDYLINYLLEENRNIKVDVPSDMKKKHDLYHALVNVRPAKKISEEYLHTEDKYLNYLLSKQTVTRQEDINVIKDSYPESKMNNSDKLALWKGDITKLKIDAIVNAAKSQGLGCFMPLHTYIDNQINTYAGVGLRLECDEYMKTINYHLDTGKSFITHAYNLPSDYVIHTVGPIITGSVTRNDQRLLEDCYINSLELARENDIKNLAFCCISTGEFRYPKTDACRCVLKCVDEYLNDYSSCFNKIVFNVFNDEDVMIYEKYIREYK